MKKLMLIVLSTVLLFVTVACTGTNEQADLFREEFSEVLELTTNSVTASDKTAVNEAISAFNDLGDVTQAFLIEEKALLYMLLARIGEIENAELISKEAERYKTDCKDTLSIKESEVTIYDKNKVIYALELYQVLGANIKEQLVEEKAHLDALLLEILHIEETLSAEAKAILDAGNFKIAFLDILSLTAESITADHKDELINAKQAFLALSQSAQAELVAEAQLIDELIFAIENSVVDFRISGQLFNDGYALFGAVIPSDFTAQKQLLNGDWVQVDWSEVQLTGLSVSLPKGRAAVVASWEGFSVEFDVVVADMVVDSAIETETAYIKKTISTAIAQASEGATIYVKEGVYVEELVIAKPLTLWGANFDRVGSEHSDEQTVILPSGSSFYEYGNKLNQITVVSSNVTIKGFTVDGDNKEFSSDKGEGTDVSISIMIYSASNPVALGIRIENNRILNANRGFIYGLNAEYTSTTTQKNIIRNNYMENCYGHLEQNDSAGNEVSWGQAVILHHNFHADFVGNTVKNATVGIQVTYTKTKGNLVANTISNNTFIVHKIGIWINQDESLEGWVVSQNTITALTPMDYSSGILLSSNARDTNVLRLLDNDIDGFDNGILSCSTLGDALVEGGTISNCKVAISLSDFDGKYTYYKDNYLFVRDVVIEDSNATHISVVAVENKEARLYIDGSTVIDVSKVESEAGRVYVQILPTSVMYATVVEQGIVTKGYFEGSGTESDPYIVNAVKFKYISMDLDAYYTQNASLAIYNLSGQIVIPRNYITTQAIVFYNCDGLSVINNGSLGAVTLASGVVFTNNGTITALTISACANAVNTELGTVNGAVSIGTSKAVDSAEGATFVNAGTINGTITVYSKDVEVTNSGTVNTAVTANGINVNANASGLLVTLTENSVIKGKITFASSGSLVNDGAVEGLITLSGQGVVFTNSGEAVAVTVSGEDVSIINNGIIEGLVTVKAVNTSIENRGTMTNSASYALQVTAVSEGFKLNNYGLIKSTANKNAVYLTANLKNIEFTNNEQGEITSDATNAIFCGAGVTGVYTNNGLVKGAIPAITAE